MPGLPDQSLHGKPLGKPGEGGGASVINFGIGGSLADLFNQTFGTMFGGGSLVRFFDDLFFGSVGGSGFGIGAGAPGSAIYVPWPNGIFGGDRASANGPLIGF